MVEQNFKTILQDSCSELVIEKSKFIVTVKKIIHEEQALFCIQQVKKQYWDATHNCTAYLLVTGGTRSNDDGEPAGTAGKPILECLKKHEVTNALVIVTRYFGGIKLGAGGLIRAYTAATQKGIQQSGVVHSVYHQVFCLKLDYGNWEKVEGFFKQSNIKYEKPEFSEKIKVIFYTNDEDKIISHLKNILLGKLNIEQLTGKFIEVLLQKPL